MIEVDGGGAHLATPDGPLTPSVHGPVAAFGLDALTQGAAEAGLHEVAGASRDQVPA